MKLIIMPQRSFHVHSLITFFFWFRKSKREDADEDGSIGKQRFSLNFEIIERRAKVHNPVECSFNLQDWKHISTLTHPNWASREIL